MKKSVIFNLRGGCLFSVFVLEPIKGRADAGEESSQR